MSKKRNQIEPLKKLAQWFEREQRILPWREDPSPYRVWISEIMLQQTQVVTVVPYFERFIAKFSTLEKLAHATEEQVLLLWQGLGYYSRARNIHRGAKLILARVREGAGWPKTREEWLEVPGVGPYTAGAILSISQNQPEAILDGNVERVLTRYLRIPRGVSESQYKAKLWDYAATGVTTALAAKISPSTFNQALMELGARVCTPKTPRCSECPVRTSCRANLCGDPLAYPEPKPRAERKKIFETVVCYIDSSRKRVLLQQEPDAKWRQGLWDFPVVDAQVRSKLLKEKIDSFEVKYVVTRHDVRRQVIVVEKKPSREENKWVSIAKPAVPVGAPTRKILKYLAQGEP